MFIEKLFKFNGDNKKKIESLSFLLIILIITVIVINIIWKDDNTSKNNNNEESQLVDSNINITENDLQTKLENILSNINGVGSVKVLITYNQTEEIVPIYNKTDKTSTTNETDSSGGTRTVQEFDSSTEVVYQNDAVIIQKKINPKIEGAVITASGANNAEVKTNIILAVEAVTGLATHKIQVFEKVN